MVLVVNLKSIYSLNVSAFLDISLLIYECERMECHFNSTHDIYFVVRLLISIFCTTVMSTFRLKFAKLYNKRLDFALNVELDKLFTMRSYTCKEYRHFKMFVKIYLLNILRYFEII